jgi:hypothetical protein
LQAMESVLADRARPVASHFGRLQRHRSSTSRRNPQSQLRSPLPRTLPSRWHTSQPELFYQDEQGKGNCPLPLQPHPQNQPNPIGERITLKPDTSLATKTGHFNLLRTEPRRGMLPGTAARTKKLRAERAADAYQQGRRSLSANAAGARSTAYLGAVRS